MAGRKQPLTFVVTCGGAFGYHAWEVKLAHFTKSVLVVRNPWALRSSTEIITDILCCGLDRRPVSVDDQAIGFQPHFQRLPTAGVYSSAHLRRSGGDRALQPRCVYRQRSALPAARRSGSRGVLLGHGFDQLQQAFRYHRCPEFDYMDCQRFD